MACGRDTNMLSGHLQERKSIQLRRKWLADGYWLLVPSGFASALKPCFSQDGCSGRVKEGDGTTAGEGVRKSFRDLVIFIQQL